MGRVSGPLPKPSLSCLTEYWSRLWQRDWASQHMLRLASWTAGTTAGKKPSPSEYKGDFYFFLQMAIWKYLLSVCQASLAQYTTGLPVVGPVLKREQSAQKRKEEEFTFYITWLCVRQTLPWRVQKTVCYVCTSVWMIASQLFQYQNANVLSKHMQTHQQQQKQQQHTSICSGLLHWIWFIYLSI